MTRNRKWSPLLTSAHSRYVFYLRLFLAGRTPALPGTLTGGSFYDVFPISSAKVLHFFDICKFYGHKITKYVVKHKKNAPGGTFFHKQNNKPYAVGATSVRRYSVLEGSIESAAIV